MNFLFAIVVTFYPIYIASKKLDMSSEESIENILFYKDFRPKKKELAPLPPEPLVLPAQVKQPECVPRMCCSMSCTNSCGQNEIGPESLQRNQPMSFNPGNSNPFSSMNHGNSNPFNSMNPGNSNPFSSMNSMSPMSSMNSFNSMGPMNSMKPMHTMTPGQQPPFMKHPKKKKLPTIPLPTRRDMGHTREHIKSLISKDEDIKKILKDLVRVTMKKVDLLELIKARRAAESDNDGFDIGDVEDDEKQS